MTTTGRVRLAVVAASALTLAVSTITATQASAETAEAAAVVPELDWQPCDDLAPGLECATADVPLDHDEPDGATTELALARYPATDTENRVGSLFVNPGGPGGSGVGLAASFGPFLSERTDGVFDVVGFDPRGVAASDPVRCFRTEDEFVELLGDQPIFPYRPRQEPPFFAAYSELGRACVENGGPVLEHMSTGDVARDMDLLREAVGDETLTYLGFSYGSFLGNTYVNLFPDRVRAVVLDGVLDPQRWADGRQIEIDQTQTELVLGELFRLCDEAGPQACAYAGDTPSEQRYEALADAVRAEPIDLDEFDYTYDFLVADGVGTTYSTSSWPAFAELLAELDAVRAGDADAAGDADGARQQLHAALTAPSPAQEPQEEYDNGFDAYLGNHCGDAEYPPRRPQWTIVSRQAEQVGRAGPLWWWSNAPCATMPANDDRYGGPWDADTAEPLLVVGNYFDAATGYPGAVRTAENLPGSRLLSYAGWGHTAYGVTECVTSAIDEYLVSGALPDEGAVCPAAPNPFTGVGIQRATSAPPVLGTPPPWWLRP